MFTACLLSFCVYCALIQTTGGIYALVLELIKCSDLARHWLDGLKPPPSKKNKKTAVSPFKRAHLALGTLM